MAKARQRRHVVGLSLQDGVKNRFGLIEASQRPQVAGKLQPDADVLRVESGSGFEGFGSTSMIAAPAPRVAAFNQRAEVARFRSQHSFDDGLGIIKATKRAQVARKLEPDADMLWLDRRGGLEGFGGPRLVTAFAAEVAALDQGAELAGLSGEKRFDNGLGLVESIEGAEIAGEFKLDTDMLRLDRGSGFERFGGARMVAATAMEMAALD